MNNRDLEATWHYHNSTKHSYASVRTERHSLDWPNYPLPFKIYSDLEPLPLPHEWPESRVAALEAISSTEPAVDGKKFPDLRTLASILYHSAGITRRRNFPGGEISFRAAACTGALYEIELYLICGELSNLEAGIYHFNPGDFALRRLRTGDYRGVLTRATANESSVAYAPVTVLCAGTYWRNAWKYQARTYRHFFWDNGTILANLLGIAFALGIPARLVMGFIDGEVNSLLGLNTEREVAISLVALGGGLASAPKAPAQIEPLDFKTAPLSRKEVDYPLMRNTHGAGSLETAEEVRDWRGGTPVPGIIQPGGKTFALDALPSAALSQQTIEQVIVRRGSTRHFAREPIGYEQLSAMLLQATRGIPADFLEPIGARLNDLYLIVNAVEGLPAGAYYLLRDQQKLELLKEEDFRGQAGYLGLEQQLPADASVNFFFLAELKSILERFGNRGYRSTQMEAGIIGGRLYLAAYALGLGATGLTFYDDEVTGFFSPHAGGKSAIFLVAAGIPAKRHFVVR